MNKIRKIIKNDPKDNIILEVRDLKQQDWFPQVKLMRWDNETNFSIRHEGGAKYNFYDIEEGEGGYEFEVILEEKPPTNKVKFTIQSKNLDFFYQPELTPEEIAEGVSRPDDVVGSYAVYHKTKGGMNRSDGMDYKVGKAFHIYRPYAHDANGMGVWADLKISGGHLTITIPQDFLDNAAYPLTTDPTFGYTTEGGSIFTIIVGSSNIVGRVGYVVTPSESGTLDKITAFLVGDASFSADTIVFLNEKDSIAANSHGEVDSVENLDVSHTTTATWVDFTASGESFSSTDYILNITGNEEEAGDSLGRVKFDTGGTSYQENFTGAGRYAASKEDPWTVSASATSRQLSIYATYTASGGTEVPTIQNQSFSYGFRDRAVGY